MKIHLIQKTTNKKSIFTFVYFPFKRLKIIKSFDSKEPEWWRSFETIKDAENYLSTIN